MPRRGKGQPAHEVSEGERAALLDLAAVERRWRAVELRVFRERLVTTVRFVSPVLVDLAALEGLTLDGVVKLLRPGRAAAPGRLVRRSQLAWWHAAHYGHRPNDVDWRFGVNGRVLRHRHDPRGVLAVRAAGDTIDVAVGIGGACLETSGRTATLWLPEPLPAMVLSACVGMQLDAIADHPLFNGRGYVVTDVRDGGTRQALVIDTGVTPYRVPWKTSSFNLPPSGPRGAGPRHGRRPSAAV